MVFGKKEPEVQGLRDTEKVLYRVNSKRKTGFMKKEKNTMIITTERYLITGRKQVKFKKSVCRILLQHYGM